MTARVRIAETGDVFEVGDGETVLQGALRAKVRLAHSCTLGGCGTCRVKVTEGHVTYDALPLALSEAEAEQGYALACQARPAGDLLISVGRTLADPQRQAALVTDVSAFNADVMHLSLVLPDLGSFEYRAGQHMNVHLEGGGRRSFSMASVPEGNAADFHVRRVPGGRFTDGILPGLQPGDLIDVELPLGAFRFHEEDYRELVMVATGTGISPIKSILESLFDDPDCPPISLYWGMRQESDLYLDEHIRTWGERLYEFRYEPVLSRAGASWQGRRGYVQDAVLRDHPDLAEHSIYLCGSPRMIHDAKNAFLARGASVEHIYADGFNFQHGA